MSIVGFPVLDSNGVVCCSITSVYFAFGSQVSSLFFCVLIMFAVCLLKSDFFHIPWLRVDSIISIKVFIAFCDHF